MDDQTVYVERTLRMDPSEPFAKTLLLAEAAPPADALPDGTLIEGFRILRQLGEGGFGIVYLAWDAALERHVAIKEYMPASLAVRSHALLEVSVRSERNRPTFDAGLKSFVNEARLLARFDHPALVKVFRFWEANRTAYMAMPYYEGPTLKAALARSAARPSEDQLRDWLHPLLDALAVLHAAKCYHRDISPDNILLTGAGPLLLDFGAARRVISDMTQALTAVLKPGFAPIEQYGAEMLQGPWTDLYALAGVVHFAITGRPPPASVARVVRDTLRPLSVSHAGAYGDAFLRAIDTALAIRPEARPQDVAQFRSLLDAEPASEPSPENDSAAPMAPPAPPGPAASAESPAPAAPAPPSSAQDRAQPRHKLAYAASALSLVALAGSLAWLPWRAPDAAPAVRPSSPMAVPAPASVPAAAPAAAPASAPSLVVPAAPIAQERAKPHGSGLPAPPVTESRRRTRPELESASAGAAVKAKPPRCGDIVQKSSLESLSAEEIAYLKKECR